MPKSWSKLIEDKAKCHPGMLLGVDPDPPKLDVSLLRPGDTLKTAAAEYTFEWKPEKPVDLKFTQLPVCIQPHCPSPIMPGEGMNLCSVHYDEIVAGAQKDGDAEYRKKQAADKKAWSRKLREDQAGQMMTGRASAVGSIWNKRG